MDTTNFHDNPPIMHTPNEISEANLEVASKDLNLSTTSDNPIQWVCGFLFVKSTKLQVFGIAAPNKETWDQKVTQKLDDYLLKFQDSTKSLEFSCMVTGPWTTDSQVTELPFSVKVLITAIAESNSKVYSAENLDPVHIDDQYVEWVLKLETLLDYVDTLDFSIEFSSLRMHHLKKSLKLELVCLSLFSWEDDSIHDQALFFVVPCKNSVPSATGPVYQKRWLKRKMAERSTFPYVKYPAFWRSKKLRWVMNLSS